MKWHISLHPELGDISTEKRDITYTRHAIARMREKSIRPCNMLDIKKEEVFELERLRCGTFKLAIRKPYDEKWDVCYVLIPLKDGWKILTAWKNKIEDRHFTLDKAKYAPKGAAIY